MQVKLEHDPETDAWGAHLPELPGAADLQLLFRRCNERMGWGR